MTREEKEAIIESIRSITKEYSRSKTGAWLNELKWEEIPVSIKKLPEDVCGMYSLGRIWLMESLVPESIFPTYVHELRHRWQWSKSRILYMLGKIYRPLIEKDAVAREEESGDWLMKEEAKKRN